MLVSSTKTISLKPGLDRKDISSIYYGELERLNSASLAMVSQLVSSLLLLELEAYARQSKEVEHG